VRIFQFVGALLCETRVEGILNGIPLCASHNKNFDVCIMYNWQNVISKLSYSATFSVETFSGKNKNQIEKGTPNKFPLGQPGGLPNQYMWRTSRMFPWWKIHCGYMAGVIYHLLTQSLTALHYHSSQVFTILLNHSLHYTFMKSRWKWAVFFSVVFLYFIQQWRREILGTPESVVDSKTIIPP
jgi:hypothetical protein